MYEATVRKNSMMVLLTCARVFAAAAVVTMSAVSRRAAVQHVVQALSHT